MLTWLARLSTAYLPCNAGEGQVSMVFLGRKGFTGVAGTECTRCTGRGQRRAARRRSGSTRQKSCWAPSTRVTGTWSV